MYGIDIKMVENKPLIIEINDKPSIDADVEDAYAGDQLYITIMLEFLKVIVFPKDSFHIT